MSGTPSQSNEDSNMGKQLASLAEWTFLAVVLIGAAQSHGTWREFASHGLLRTVVAEGDEQHLGGQPLDPIALGLFRSGCETIVRLVPLIAIVAGIAYLAYTHRRLRKQWARVCESIRRACGHKPGDATVGRDQDGAEINSTM